MSKTWRDWAKGSDTIRDDYIGQGNELISDVILSAEVFARIRTASQYALVTKSALRFVSVYAEIPKDYFLAYSGGVVDWADRQPYVYVYNNVVDNIKNLAGGEDDPVQVEKNIQAAYAYMVTAFMLRGVVATAFETGLKGGALWNEVGRRRVPQITGEEAKNNIASILYDGRKWIELEYIDDEVNELVSLAKGSVIAPKEWPKLNFGGEVVVENGEVISGGNSELIGLDKGGVVDIVKKVWPIGAAVVAGIFLLN